ncbi:ABC transporter permease [Pusillimonas sp. CC-YST705]|uniref:ABC transporter permease n=1 Tax=Mesopusillimonas faecipullorum TaxID=2755040 RepID=A0ABS8CFR1_9BURK|nr:ABC transporter permease [Mesopusillimonas faecipullorum]MCB5364882.1 ABC transporter permease [Mesopusillimonas faecipullorum]
MELMIAGLVAAGIRLSISIVFAALGETVSQRAGVMNVGLEGIMLFSAFLAAAGAVYTGSPWGGTILAIAGGVVLAALHGWVSIYLCANQIVSGLALVFLGAGLSGVGYRLTIGGGGPVSIPSFAAVDFGPLREIPFIGQVLFSHTLLVYVAIVLAVVLYFGLSRTGWGLELRAAGENPQAADAAGVSVNRYRLMAVLFGGAMAGLGGAFLVLAQVNAFVEGMVAGRGFIAIACVVFGGWNPLGVLVACLGFGLADALQIRLQTWYPGVPYQFFVMMPYGLALVALVIFARRSAAPAALGLPFRSLRAGRSA